MKRLIIMLTMLSITIGFAQETLKVVTFQIPVMVESKSEGVFIELVNATAEKAGIKVEIEVLPPPRAIGGFMSKSFDMLFPALDIQFHGKEKPLASKEIIYVKQDFAFTKKGNNVIKNISELEGKSVGITAGYPYSEEILFNKNLKIQEAPSDDQNVKKLINNRIDVFIVEEKSGLGAFAKENTQEFEYASEFPISKQDVYFAFQKNTKGTKLEEKFSKALLELKNNGVFGNIMSKAK